MIIYDIDNCLWSLNQLKDSLHMCKIYFQLAYFVSSQEVSSQSIYVFIIVNRIFIFGIRICWTSLNYTASNRHSHQLRSEAIIYFFSLKEA